MNRIWHSNLKNSIQEMSSKYHQLVEKLPAVFNKLCCKTVNGVTESKKGRCTEAKKGHYEFAKVLEITKPFISSGCFKKKSYYNGESSGKITWLKWAIYYYYPGERAIQIFSIFARRHWLKVTSQRAMFSGIARYYSDSGIV